MRDLVPHRLELVDDAVGNGRLDDHAHAGLVAESSDVHRLLNVHPEYEHVNEELRMSLRLHSAAHQAERHVRLVAASVSRGVGTRLRDESRNERVKRTLARRHGVRQTWLHRESRPAIVQREPGARHDDPRAEFVEQAVDERHHVAVFVRDREIDRLARRALRTRRTPAPAPSSNRCDFGARR